jgi:hypothetical protein
LAPFLIQNPLGGLAKISNAAVAGTGKKQRLQNNQSCLWNVSHSVKKYQLNDGSTSINTTLIIKPKFDKGV